MQILKRHLALFFALMLAFAAIFHLLQEDRQQVKTGYGFIIVALLLFLIWLQHRKEKD